MDLMEYEARSLFEEEEIPILKGITVESPDDLDGKYSFPVVVKAQIMAGGRGKAGGIRIANDQEELRSIVTSMLGSTLRDHPVRTLLIVEKVEIKKEMYLSILLDRNLKKHRIIFSPFGGVEIEETAKMNPDRIFKLDIDPLLGYTMQDGLYLGEKAKLTTVLKKDLAVLIDQLYKVVRSNDCLLAEINPLVISGNDQLIALDAKISVDDSGVFRHSRLVEMKKAHTVEPLVQEAAQFRFLYIPCDPAGNVVIMSNGSGMLMSCIDHITRNGNKVAAVLDLGGGATSDRIEHAVRILFKTNGAEILFVNIFGGITRCDEVALGIRQYLEKDGHDRPIVVCFEGTNRNKGLEILRDLPGITCADGLIRGEEAVRRLVK